jgi:hypothetical protein
MPQQLRSQLLQTFRGDLASQKFLKLGLRLVLQHQQLDSKLMCGLAQPVHQVW